MKRLKLKDVIVTKQTILIHFIAFFAFVAGAFLLYAIPPKAQISAALIVGGVNYGLSFFELLAFDLYCERYGQMVGEL